MSANEYQVWIVCNDDDNYMDQPPHLVTPAHYFLPVWFLFYSKILSFFFLVFGYNLVLFLYFPGSFNDNLSYYFFFLSNISKKKMIQIEGGKRKPKSVIMIFLRLYTHTLTRTKILCKKKRWISCCCLEGRCRIFSRKGFLGKEFFLFFFLQSRWCCLQANV